MFTEQPAPPQAAAHVQVQPAAIAAPQSAPSPAPTERGVAAPETIPVKPLSNAAPVEAPKVAPEPTPLPSRVPEPSSSSSAPAASSSSSPAEAVKAQRRQEVEQALIKLTNQARAKQKEQQQQQAATEAAKYLEAGDIEQAQLATKFITLPADVRAKLLKRIAEVQTKKGKSTVAKGSRPGLAQGEIGSDRQGLASGYVAPAGGYSTQAILPSMSINISFPYGKLMGKGNFKLSFPLGVIAPITSIFGWRIHPIDGSPRFHRGTDFGAPYGSPVVAAMAGVVEAAGYMDGYGLTVILRHNNQQTLYAHMSQVFVKAGDVLKQGQLLGQVGSTGNSTGPHLHFEVHQLTDQGWVALDPAALLNQALAIAQQLPSKPIAFNGQLVNLSASGLLDLNAPSPDFSDLRGGSMLLSNLLSPFQDEHAPVRVPFTLIPPAIPEFGWLISPFVDNLLAGQAAFIALPGLPEAPQTISFQPIPSLAVKPAESVAANSWTTAPSQPHRLQVATSKPLAHLTIAESMPGVVNVASLRQPTSRKPRATQKTASLPGTPSFKPIQVTEQGLQSLKLSDSRLRR